ncbi:hypothetical protein [Ensifer soli]|uniref:hypothetical protein n=1 Tax=Ciceribacter sp. sgz301302 TaxID=3342379 RepID=UPI0035B9F05F
MSGLDGRDGSAAFPGPCTFCSRRLHPRRAKTRALIDPLCITALIPLVERIPVDTAVAEIIAPDGVAFSVAERRWVHETFLMGHMEDENSMFPVEGNLILADAPSCRGSRRCLSRPTSRRFVESAVGAEAPSRGTT